MPNVKRSIRYIDDEEIDSMIVNLHGEGGAVIEVRCDDDRVIRATSMAKFFISKWDVEAQEFSRSFNHLTTDGRVLQYDLSGNDPRFLGDETMAALLDEVSALAVDTL